MRIAILLGILILLVVVFIPRAGDEAPPAAPSSTADAGAPVAEPDANSESEKSSGDVSAGEQEGKLRFRFVTAEKKDAPPVPGAVVTIYHREPEGWVEVGGATADADGVAEVGGLRTEGTRFGHQGVAVKEGRGPTWIGSMQPGAEPETKTIVLPEPSPLEGRILDAVTGLPVAGARVRARCGGDLIPFHDQVEIDQSPVVDEAMTAEGGRFHLEATGRLLEVTADGYATTRRDAGDPPVEIRLPPGAEIAGRVTDEDGQPVADAQVFACTAWASTHDLEAPTEWRMRNSPMSTDDWVVPGSLEHYFTAEVTRTDKDGRYRLTGLAVREEHWVWAVVGGGPRTRITPVRTDGSACDLRFARPATLVVRLSSPDARGIRVFVVPDGEPGWLFQGRTGPGSVVRVEGILPGSYRLAVNPGSSRENWSRSEFAEGEEVIREIEVPVPGPPGPPPGPPPETVEVTGSVVDDLERPIPGARVTCVWDPRGTRTDEAGRFTLRVAVDHPTQIRATAAGHHGKTGEKGALRLVLTRVIRMTILLRAPDGGPGITEVRWRAGGREMNPHGRHGVREYLLETEFAAGIRKVRVRVQGYRPVTVPVPADADGTVEAPELLLSLGATVRFRVTGRDRREIVAWVVVQGGPEEPVWTDKQGRVAVTGLPPKRTVQAWFYAHGYLNGAWKGMPGDGEVTIRMSPKARLRGEVRYDDGLPAGAIRVTAYRLVEGEKDDWGDSVHADNVGRFTLMLPPGKYRLEFRPPTSATDPKTTSRSVTLHADRDNVYAFEIPRP